MKNEYSVQFGESLTADLEENTWTFEMNEDKAKAIAILYSLIAFVSICSLVVGVFIGVCVTK